MDATLEVTEKLLRELDEIRTSAVGGPFTQREMDSCDKFLGIVVHVEPTLAAMHGLLVSAYGHIDVDDLDVLSGELRNLYFQMYKSLIPFVNSLQEHCRQNGDVFPALERFELSEKNIEAKVAKYESDDDELEDLIWREKARAITPSNEKLIETSRRQPPPPEWYERDIEY